MCPWFPLFTWLHIFWKLCFCTQHEKMCDPIQWHHESIYTLAGIEQTSLSLVLVRLDIVLCDSFLSLSAMFSKFICIVSVLHSFIYLFLAVLGLCCCSQAFSSCCEWGLLLSSCGVQAPGAWAQKLQHMVLVAPEAGGIFPDQGSNPCTLHWQVNSKPLDHRDAQYFILFYWQIAFHCEDVLLRLGYLFISGQTFGLFVLCGYCE